MVRPTQVQEARVVFISLIRSLQPRVKIVGIY
jgi:hypothetical protein